MEDGLPGTVDGLDEVVLLSVLSDVRNRLIEEPRGSLRPRASLAARCVRR